MIQYLVDEVGPGGSQAVPMLEDDDGELPNCKATGVFINWDDGEFVRGGAWSAKGVSGPLQGRVFTCALDTFSEEKWDIVDAIHKYGVEYGAANRKQLRDAAFDFIENHCLNLLAGAD